MVRSPLVTWPGSSPGTGRIGRVSHEAGAPDRQASRSAGGRGASGQQRLDDVPRQPHRSTDRPDGGVSVQRRRGVAPATAPIRRAPGRAAQAAHEAARAVRAAGSPAADDLRDRRPRARHLRFARPRRRGAPSALARRSGGAALTPTRELVSTAGQRQRLRRSTRRGIWLRCPGHRSAALTAARACRPDATTRGDRATRRGRLLRRRPTTGVAVTTIDHRRPSVRRRRGNRQPVTGRRAASDDGSPSGRSPHPRQPRSARRRAPSTVTGEHGDVNRGSARTRAAPRRGAVSVARSTRRVSSHVARGGPAP